jgi:UDP:flavonoid glycosyltransferase YjiC (YdhE family)
MEPAAGLVSRHLGLRFLSIASALPLERDERIPPPYLDWPYATTEDGIRRNRGGENVAGLLLRKQRRTITRWARHFALDGIGTIEDCLSPAGTLAQLPESLDFPRAATSRPLIRLGPLRQPDFRKPLALAIDRRRPFVFMSLGTLQGHRYSIFRAVAKACRRSGAQLLIAHCGGLSEQQAQSLGANWVTDFAPQRDVLALADICVTHGGQNTVLDALSAGKPVLVIPIAFDHPGIAARVAHHRVGIKLSPRFLTSRKVYEALQDLLSNPSYAERARSVGRAMSSTNAVAQAVSHIERLLGGSETILCESDP